MTERYCIFPGYGSGLVSVGRITAETAKTYTVETRSEYGAAWSRGTRKSKDDCYRVVDTLEEAVQAKASAEAAWKNFAKRVNDARSLLTQAETERARAFIAAARGEPQ